MFKSSSLLSAIILSITLFFTAAVHAQSEQLTPPEGYRQLPDLVVLGEANYAQWGGSGQGLTLEQDGSGKLPRLGNETYQDSPIHRLQISGDPSQGGWWQVLLAGKDWEGYSIAPYLDDGALEMNIRLQNGSEDFTVNLTDIVPGRTPLNIESNKVNISAYASPTVEWQAIRIPLSDLLGSDGQFNPNQLLTIALGPATFDLLTVDFNQVRFTTSQLEQASPTIKLNQLGYTPGGIKSIRVSGFPEELSAQAGTPFEIRSVPSNAVVFTGQLEELTPFDERVSGERVLEARFDGLTEPGTYYLAVDAFQIDDSEAFEIKPDLYDELLYDTMRYFYLQRAGMPIEERYAGQYARPAGHLQDQSVSLRSGERSGIDVSGGWYDAGDYGKYTNAGATAVSDLLWTYEMFPNRFVDNQFDIPEGNNGLPDLIDEIRWELEWILTMQDPESGGFYHMVQPTEDASPADALEPRYIEDQEGGRTNIRPTSTTGSAVAILAHGATVFEAFDPAFADEMDTAARFGWAYLEANPNTVTPMEGPYSDKVDSDNRFWAATALYRLTGEARYHDYIRSAYAGVPTQFVSTNDNAYGVNDMGMIGWLPYLYSAGQDEAVISFFEGEFLRWSEHMTSRWENSVWGYTLLDEDFYWGSNYVVLTTPLVMYIGADALGDEQLKETASAISQTGLDYLLGTNPLSLSYITGYGENSINKIYSVQWSEDGIEADPPGVMAGGPNEYTNTLIYSNFAGKRYIDGNNYWTLNEHTIYWNSPVVFHAALQIEQPGGTLQTDPVAQETPESEIEEPASTSDARVEPTQIAEPTSLPDSTESPTEEPLADPTADPAAEEEIALLERSEDVDLIVTGESGQASSGLSNLLIVIIAGLGIIILILALGLIMLWRRVDQLDK